MEPQPQEGYAMADDDLQVPPKYRMLTMHEVKESALKDAET